MDQSHDSLNAEVDRLAPEPRAEGINLPPQVAVPFGRMQGTQNPILKFFNYTHLPSRLQAVAARFYDLAHCMNGTMPDSAEKSAGLRKLLEAKDCFVRAAME